MTNNYKNSSNNSVIGECTIDPPRIRTEKEIKLDRCNIITHNIHRCIHKFYKSILNKDKFDSDSKTATVSLYYNFMNDVFKTSFYSYAIYEEIDNDHVLSGLLNKYINSMITAYNSVLELL